jgi:hypothetical protein
VSAPAKDESTPAKQQPTAEEEDVWKLLDADSDDEADPSRDPVGTTKRTRRHAHTRRHATAKAMHKKHRRDVVSVEQTSPIRKFWARISKAFREGQREAKDQAELLQAKVTDGGVTPQKAVTGDSAKTNEAKENDHKEDEQNGHESKSVGHKAYPTHVKHLPTKYLVAGQV